MWPSAEQELDDPGRSRAQLATGRDDRREPAPGAETRDDDARALQRFRDISAVRNDEVERSSPSSGRDAQSAQLEPSHDPAGSAHDHDDAQPQAHRHTRVPQRARAQEDEGVVVAGLDAPWELRRDEERDAGVRRQREVPRSQRKPANGRARAAAADDPGTASHTESEAGAVHVDDDTLRARVRHSDGRTRGAREQHSSRHRAERDRRPSRARSRGCGDERELECGDADPDERARADHRPITVNVTVAV
jgi:hypothetical protein